MRLQQRLRFCWTHIHLAVEWVRRCRWYSMYSMRGGMYILSHMIQRHMMYLHRLRLVMMVGLLATSMYSSTHHRHMQLRHLYTRLHRVHIHTQLRHIPTQPRISMDPIVD